MKAWTIAVFTFIFMLSLNMLSGLGIFKATCMVDSSWGDADFLEAYATLNTSMGSATGVAEATPSSWGGAPAMVSSGVLAFGIMLVKSVVLAPETLGWMIGCMGASTADTTVITALISVLVLMVYAAAAIQFFADRRFGEME